MLLPNAEKLAGAKVMIHEPPRIFKDQNRISHSFHKFMTRHRHKVRRTAKINASIYLPLVVSCEPVEQSNHERKMEAITASIHPSTSSGRTEAVAKNGMFYFCRSPQANPVELPIFA